MFRTDQSSGDKKVIDRTWENSGERAVVMVGRPWPGRGTSEYY
jgi:hypothetical protein